jgi:hypothetical protein
MLTRITNYVAKVDFQVHGRYAEFGVNLGNPPEFLHDYLMKKLGSGYEQSRGSNSGNADFYIPP